MNPTTDVYTTDAVDMPDESNILEVDNLLAIENDCQSTGTKSRFDKRRSFSDYKCC